MEEMCVFASQSRSYGLLMLRSESVQAGKGSLAKQPERWHKKGVTG